MDYRLSKREVEVMNLISAGYTYGEISGQLCVSMRTVEAHIRHAAHKLKARNVRNAIAIFARTQLVGE